MVSLRESIYKGSEAASISVRDIAQQYQLSFPISLRTLIAPEQYIFQSGSMSAGSLSGWGEWTIFSNGWSRFRGHLESDAIIIGDKYVFTAWPNYKDESNTVLVVENHGEISPRDHAEWDKSEHSPWIAKNWEALKNQNFPLIARLHTDPDADFSDVLKIIIPLLTFAAIVLLPKMYPDHCSYYRDEEGGNAGTRCDW